jgi:hypothetical protein
MPIRQIFPAFLFLSFSTNYAQCLSHFPNRSCSENGPPEASSFLEPRDAFHYWALCDAAVGRDFAHLDDRHPGSCSYLTHTDCARPCSVLRRTVFKTAGVGG